MVCLIIYPLLYNIYLSFHEVTLINIRKEWDYVGIENYIRVLKSDGTWESLYRTVIFLIATVVGEMVIGLISALTLNIDFKGKGIVISLIMMPMIITPIAVGLFWRMLLNTEWGIINYYVQQLGFDPVVWLGTPNTAMMSVILVEIWWGVSFVILVLLGGLSSLPIEPYEAAEVDGASPWQKFIYITLPLLKPVLIVIATIRTIDAFRAFDLIFALTKGGPAGATRLFSVQIYYTAFERTEFGRGAAAAMFLFVIAMILSMGLIKNLISGEPEKV
jgi:multiple sugar transport system permease protein